MELAANGMKTSGTTRGRAGRGSDTAALLIRTVHERWLGLRARRQLRDLDRLDDRLLRDVGLRREQLPSGARRIERF